MHLIVYVEQILVLVHLSFQGPHLSKVRAHKKVSKPCVHQFSRKGWYL